MRILVFLILFLPLGLHAEGNDIDSLLSVRDGLRGRIDSLREKEIIIRRERDLWLDSIEMLHNFSYNVDSLNAGIKSTEQLEAELRRKYEDFIRAREDAKVEVDNEGEKLKAKKATLEPYLPAYLQARSSEFITYTERLYSQMDKSTLEKYLAETAMYKDRAEMREAFNCLNFALATTDLLNVYRNLLQQPFDKVLVKQARDTLFYLTKPKLAPKQWDEIYGTLDAYLSRYESGVIKFRELLKELEDGDDVKTVFFSRVNEENEERYYNNIPYLRDRYTWIRNSMINGRDKDKVLNSKKYKEIRSEIESVTTK